MYKEKKYAPFLKQETYKFENDVSDSTVQFLVNLELK